MMFREVLIYVRHMSYIPSSLINICWRYIRSFELLAEVLRHEIDT